MSGQLFPRGRNRIAVRLLAPAVVALWAFAASCGGKSSKPVIPEVPVPPTPNSPANALRLLEWSWDQRSLSTYRDVLTDDFLFEFSPSDTAGITVNRTEELEIAANLFTEGVPGHPAAGSVVFNVDNTLITTNDDRPGKTNSKWHKRIATSVRLIVSTTGPDYSTSGDAVFYFTRGDSAQIPADMVARGFGPDSTRWYVDHWADVTVCPVGKVCVSVGTIKLVYAGGPVAASRVRAAGVLPTEPRAALAGPAHGRARRSTP